eukprot:COSAG01_NODE_4264_length_5198_cov_3.619337_1_plen_421_part_00
MSSQPRRRSQQGQGRQALPVRQGRGSGRTAGSSRSPPAPRRRPAGRWLDKAQALENPPPLLPPWYHPQLRHRARSIRSASGLAPSGLYQISALSAEPEAQRGTAAALRRDYYGGEEAVGAVSTIMEAARGQPTVMRILQEEVAKRDRWLAEKDEQLRERDRGMREMISLMQAKDQQISSLMATALISTAAQSQQQLSPARSQQLFQAPSPMSYHLEQPPSSPLLSRPPEGVPVGRGRGTPDERQWCLQGDGSLQQPTVSSPDGRRAPVSQPPATARHGVAASAANTSPPTTPSQQQHLLLHAGDGRTAMVEALLECTSRVLLLMGRTERKPLAQRAESLLEDVDRADAVAWLGSEWTEVQAAAVIHADDAVRACEKTTAAPATEVDSAVRAVLQSLEDVRAGCVARDVVRRPLHPFRRPF